MVIDAVNQTSIIGKDDQLPGEQYFNETFEQ